MAEVRRRGRPSTKKQAELASVNEDKHAVYYRGRTFVNQDGESFVQAPSYDEKFKPNQELKGAFDFTIKKVPSILNNITLVEPIDKHLLEKCIASNEVCKLSVHYNSAEIYTNLKQQLAAFHKKILNGKVKVNYTIPSKAVGFGRVSANQSLSLGVFRREVRHALSKNLYVDIDIANAQVEMLYQFCKAHKLATPCLERYCLNRDEYFDAVANSYTKHDGTPLSVKLENGKYKYRDAIKSLFIVMIFFGGFNRWKKDYDIHSKHKRDDCDLVDEFYHELNFVSNTIMFHNKEFFNLVNAGEHTKSKVNDKGVVEEYENPMGRAMSIFLQDLERRCIECVYTYLEEIKVINNYEAVYCFDGIMVLQKYWNKHNESELLNALSSVVKSKLGFDLKFTVKPFDEGDCILASFKPMEIPQHALDKFDKVYFDSLETYTDKKIYFERFFCKVRNDNLIYQIYFNVSNCSTVEEKADRQADTCFFAVEKFASAFRDLRYIEYNPSKEKEEEEEFVKEWLNDTNIKVSQKIEFTPYNKSESQMLDFQYDDEFRANLFTGYSDKIHSTFTKGKSIKYWLATLKELCEGNDEYMNYVVNLLATKIQYPTRKLPIGLIIMGAQGTGKNTILNSVGRVIGDRHYISSSKANDFFGEYAEGFVNKLIVNMNEVEGKDTMDLQGRMKEFITEDKITVNMKFLRPIPVKNHALLVLFSNKSNPIQIDVRSGDRRWVAFKSTNKFLDKNKYGSKHWKAINELFEKPEFIAELYDFLNTIDLSNFDAIKERPITASYKQLCALSIPKEVMFLEHLFSHHLDGISLLKNNTEANRLQQAFKTEVTISGSSLHSEFIRFCEDNNLITAANKPSIKKFYNDLLSLDCGINKGEDNHNKTTQFSWKYGEIFKKLYERKLSDIYGDSMSKEQKIEDILGQEQTQKDEFFGDLY
jgi:hypothetical protein